MPTYPPEIQPGSLVACHSADIEGKIIRFGESIRFRLGDFYNHFAIIDDHPTDDPKDPYVIQAEARGVTGWAANKRSYSARKLSEVAVGGVYEILPPPSSDPNDITRGLAFARAQVGQEYGWLSIASIATHIIMPKWLPLPSLRSDRTWICSALAAEYARVTGWLHNWPDIYEVVPSELYAALKGLTVRELEVQFKTVV